MKYDIPAFDALYYTSGARKYKAVFFVNIQEQNRFSVHDLAVIRIDEDLYKVLQKQRSKEGRSSTIENITGTKGTYVDCWSEMATVSKKYAREFMKELDCVQIKSPAKKVDWTLTELNSVFGEIQVQVEPVVPARYRNLPGYEFGVLDGDNKHSGSIAIRNTKEDGHGNRFAVVICVHNGLCTVYTGNAANDIFRGRIFRPLDPNRYANDTAFDVVPNTDKPSLRSPSRYQSCTIKVISGEQKIVDTDIKNYLYDTQKDLANNQSLT